MTIEQALRAVRRAVRRLSPDQGRIARNNARAKVRAALRHMRAAMDAEFPVIPLERGVRGTRRKPLAEIPAGTQRDAAKLARRRLSLKRRGWAQMDVQPGMIEALAELRIPCRDIGRTIETFKDAEEWWAPAWAVKIGPDMKRLRAAKEHPRERALVLGQVALERADLGAGL